MPEIQLYPNELEFLDKNKDRFESNDLKWMQDQIDHGRYSRIILLWAYLSGNLVIHYYKDSTAFLAIKGFSPDEEDSLPFPFISSDIDDIKYWMSKGLKFSHSLIDKIFKSAKEV